MKFSVTILGSSSALPTSDRNPTAHVLNAHERFFLIDCAEGTQAQLRRYRVPMGRIHHIFISHLHGDHFYGLFGLLSSFGLLGRRVPLHLFGPDPLRMVLENHFGKVVEPLPFPIVFHCHAYDGPNLILEDERLEVTSFPLDHKIPTVGFLFREKPRLKNIRPEVIEQFSLGFKDIYSIKKGFDYETPAGDKIPNALLTLDPAPVRSYAYCSDTKYKPSLAEILRGVDLLYHEATYQDIHRERARVTSHSTARQAAEMARLAGAHQLIIGHFSARYKNLTPLIEEAKTVFPPTIEAVDGLEVGIPYRK